MEDGENNNLENKDDLNKNEKNSRTLLSFVYLIIFISIMIGLYYFYTQKDNNMELISTGNTNQILTGTNSNSGDMEANSDLGTESISGNIISTTTSTVTTTVTKDEISNATSNTGKIENNSGSQNLESSSGTTVDEEELLNNLIDNMFNSIENYEK